MKTFKIFTIFVVLILLMASSVAFPLLVSKISDQRLLGQINLQKIEENKVSPPIQREIIYNSVLDKLMLLNGMRVNSKDIVVVKNTQLSVTDQEKIKTLYKAELSKLKDKNLFPDVTTDLNDGVEISLFTCSNTSRTDLSFSFYIVKLNFSQYRITFTMDAETNKIYEFDIISTVELLVMDFDNVYLRWQDYIGLSLMKKENSKEALNSNYIKDNSVPLPFYSMPKAAEKNPASDNSELFASESLLQDYTDGSEVVTYSFYNAEDNKSITIDWYFK